MIKKILNLPLFANEPPVLIDIGASGELHPKWKKIAKYSICIAFDADDRDLQFIQKEQSNFNKLYVYNSIVTNNNVENTKFYLTKSPYCSSVLKPDKEKLSRYIHSSLFEIENVTELKAVHLQKALDDLRIKKVDWFKTDSQGTDLRLFECLDNEIRRKIIVAELEPGIIDAYEGEDKLYSVLEFMTKNNYWLADIVVKGVPRFSSELWNSEFNGELYKKLLKESLKKSPGWGEMTFFHSFEGEVFRERDYLLAWVFATIEKHYSFAYTIANVGIDKFKNDLFEELKNSSRISMKRQVYKLKFIPSAIRALTK